MSFSEQDIVTEQKSLNLKILFVPFNVFPSGIWEMLCGWSIASFCESMLLLTMVIDKI